MKEVLKKNRIRTARKSKSKRNNQQENLEGAIAKKRKKIGKGFFELILRFGK